MKTSVEHYVMILSWMILAMATNAIAQPTEPDAPIRGWGFDEFHIGGEMLLGELF